MRVRSLVDAKLIDLEFVADVLAVDFHQPGALERALRFTQARPEGGHTGFGAIGFID